MTTDKKPGFSRRKTSHLLGLGVLGLALCSAAFAETYPGRPIKIIIPATAGGTSDVLARLLSVKVQGDLGQPVVIENKPGASQTLGASLVAKSPADGYTLLLVNSSHVISPVLIKSMPYELKDLRPITILASSPLAVVTGMQQSFATMKDFLAQAKSKPEGIVIGNSEATTMLMIELLKQRAGVNLVQANYKGGAALIPDVLGSHVPAGVLGTVTASQLHKERKLKILAVTTASRSPSLPDVPTVAESGVPDFDMKVWFALMAPAAVPDDVVTKLHRAFTAALDDPDIRKKLGELGLDPIHLSPAEATSTINNEAQMWVSVAKKAGIKAD